MLFRSRDRAAIWSLFAAGAMLVLLAAMPNLSWVVGLAVWLGAFCGLAYVSGYTLLQENVVDEYRGRSSHALHRADGRMQLNAAFNQCFEFFA